MEHILTKYMYIHQPNIMRFFFCKKVGNQWKNGVVIIEHQKHVIPTKKKKQELHKMLEKKEVFT